MRRLVNPISIMLPLLLTMAMGTPVLAARTVLSAPDGATFGDTITLTVTGNSSDEEWVRVQCFANSTSEGSNMAGNQLQVGELVFDVFAYLGSSPAVIQGPDVTLGPSLFWTGGGADCEARMWATNRWKPTNIADAFSVGP